MQRRVNRPFGAAGTHRKSLKGQRVSGLRLVLLASFFLGIGAELGRAGAGPGSIDAHFGVRGHVLTRFGAGSGAYALARQRDKKIVAVGSASTAAGLAFAVARYRPDGKLDTTFGLRGHVLTPLGGRAEAHAVAVQPRDGKIVVVGETSDGDEAKLAVVRYRPNGAVDSSFGSNGAFTSKLESSSAVGYAVAIQRNGKIIVAGSTDFNFAVVRLNEDGTPDSTFGASGLVTTSFGGPRDRANALILQRNGKIIAGGRTGAYEEGDFALARYNSNGSLDPSFGYDGKVTTVIRHLDEIYGLAVQADGKIVAVGESGVPPGSPREFAIARYTESGSLDASFGVGSPVGTALTKIGSDASARAVFVMPDRRIVAVGSAKLGQRYVFALARYTRSGLPDPSFGRARGVVTTSLSRGDDFARGLVLQPPRRIVVGGIANENQTSSFALARYFLSFLCNVPRLTGLRIGFARRAIVAAHCSIGRIGRAFSSRAKKGVVLSQQPRAGARRPEGAAVRLTIGSGPGK